MSSEVAVEELLQCGFGQSPDRSICDLKAWSFVAGSVAEGTEDP